MNYIILLGVLLGVIMVAMAFVAIYHRDFIVAIVALGVVGLFASIMYLLLAAPDVAMTEAAIGSGLTTILFFYVFNRIRSIDEQNEEKQ
jgi:uncharacterized MnhB-related membrane protein